MAGRASDQRPRPKLRAILPPGQGLDPIVGGARFVRAGDNDRPAEPILLLQGPQPLEVGVADVPRQLEFDGGHKHAIMSTS